MYQAIIKSQNLISLDEDSHTYTVKDSNTQFDSVTEFIGRFFQPFNEIEIAKKLIKLDKYRGQTENDILNDWEARRKRGTLVHKEIEEFILQRDQIDLNEHKEYINKLDPKTQQAIMFLTKCNIYKNNLIFPEVKVYAEKLQLAGTIDLMIYNKPKNKISLVDWKTNLEIKKKGYKNGISPPTEHIEDCSFNKYELQLSMYRYILEKFYNVEIDGLYILHLKNQGFKYLKCEFRLKNILDMLNLNTTSKIE